jgi:hypothetical protein
VLAVLRSVLTNLGNNRAELTHAVLNLLGSLLVSGAAELVMETAVAWSLTADPSLLRHFAEQVRLAAPPPPPPPPLLPVTCL